MCISANFDSERLRAAGAFFHKFSTLSEHSPSAQHQSLITLRKWNKFAQPIEVAKVALMVFNKMSEAVRATYGKDLDQYVFVIPGKVSGSLLVNAS